MSNVKFRKVLPEPAHPMVIQLHDDLVALYAYIKEKYQAEIDQAFDRISREVGFVVSTALPYNIKVGDNRAMGIIITDGLKGTLFDRELSGVFKKFSSDSIKNISAGSYSLYIFWLEALKLKLRTDWMEPAHSNVRLSAMQPGNIRNWGKSLEFNRELTLLDDNPIPIDNRVVVGPSPWEEPAHWFDPGVVIATEEKVMILAIDEVYPELRLVDRLMSYRMAARQIVKPDVKEPAHSRQVTTPEILSEIANLLRSQGY
jgi:hypothetical protein